MNARLEAIARERFADLSALDRARLVDFATRFQALRSEEQDAILQIVDLLSAAQDRAKADPDEDARRHVEGDAPKLEDAA